MKKNLIKLITILKKLTGSVRFYKPETEKTKPKKPEKTELNRTKIQLNQFELGYE